MEGKKISRIIILSLGFLFFLNAILTLSYNIWTTKTIKILYNICFFFLFLCYVYIFLLEVTLNKFCFRKIRRIMYKKTNIIIFLFIYFVLIVCENFILDVNDGNYRKYLKICPYTISDLDLNLHLGRRCDLYNINNNSRYSYQYICSLIQLKNLNIKKTK